MIRLTILCTCFILLSTASQAQDRSILTLDVQQKLIPSFQLNNETFNRSSAREVRLSVGDIDGGRMELGFYLSQPYVASIDFGYGLSFGYEMLRGKAQWLKAGLTAGRLKMGDFRDGIYVGDIREDEYHETFKPFLEWNWGFWKHLTLFSQVGYQFLRSETETVTKVLERFEGGKPSRIQVTNDRRFYGAGWMLGAGLRLNLY